MQCVSGTDVVSWMSEVRGESGVNERGSEGEWEKVQSVSEC